MYKAVLVIGDVFEILIDFVGNKKNCFLNQIFCLESQVFFFKIFAIDMMSLYSVVVTQ